LVFLIFLVVESTQLARQLHQERTQMEVSSCFFLGVLPPPEFLEKRKNILYEHIQERGKK